MKIIVIVSVALCGAFAGCDQGTDLDGQMENGEASAVESQPQVFDFTDGAGIPRIAEVTRAQVSPDGAAVRYDAIIDGWAERSIVYTRSISGDEVVMVSGETDLESIEVVISGIEGDSASQVDFYAKSTYFGSFDPREEESTFITRDSSDPESFALLTFNPMAIADIVPELATAGFDVPTSPAAGVEAGEYATLEGAMWDKALLIAVGTYLGKKILDKVTCKWRQVCSQAYVPPKLSAQSKSAGEGDEGSGGCKDNKKPMKCAGMACCPEHCNSERVYGI